MKRKASQPALSTRRVKPRTEANVQQVVRKELRKKTDWKYCDLHATSLNVQNAGTIASLYANLTRGDAGYNNFDGNMIRPQAITLKYLFHTSQIRNAVRVIVFQWFDTTAPTLQTILQNTNTMTACLSPVLVSSKPYIKVLYDRTHQFAPTAGAYDGQNPVVVGEGVTDCYTVYIPGKRLRVTKYNSNTNTVVSGNLYIFKISDDAIQPSPQISYYARVTFSDD